MDIREQKQQLRKSMAQLKRSYSENELNSFSVSALLLLEQTPAFRQASCIALYHAIAGEVQTSGFIDKWYNKKKIVLPVICGDTLQLMLYQGPGSLKAGIFGILEPTDNSPVIATEKIDLIVVPGIAFDRKLNRMGRGKGYYDKLLSGIRTTKAGLCFDFQLTDQVPTEAFDKPMNLVVTNSEVIFSTNGKVI